MRLGFLLLVLALPLPACSSDDAASTTTGPNACVKSGGTCAANFPFRCAPGYEQVTDTDRKTACGKSEGTDPIDVACCVPEATPADTGTKDTGATDSATDAASDAVTEASADSASADSTASDAVSDVSADGG